MVCWFSWCLPHYHLCTFVLLAHELIKTPPLSGGQREEEIIVESAMNVPAFCITLFELTISIPSSFLSFLFSATVSWSQPGRLTALQIVKKKKYSWGGGSINSLVGYRLWKMWRCGVPTHTKMPNLDQKVEIVSTCRIVPNLDQKASQNVDLKHNGHTNCFPSKYFLKPKQIFLKNGI